MNAEIVARLQGSFDPHLSEVDLARAEIAAAKTRAELELARREGVALAYAIKTLVAALKGLSPDGFEPPGLLEKIEESADEALAYEEKLDVKKYVDEIQRSMERAVERAEQYMEHAEKRDFGMETLAGGGRDSAHNQVTIPAAPEPPAGKGPRPSARKSRS